MQPVRLRLPAHQQHIAACQRQFHHTGAQRRWLAMARLERLVLHAEIPLCPEGETGNGGQGTKETLIVAVVGDAVGARGVVVHEAEVELAACCLLCGQPQDTEALRDWSRWVLEVSLISLDLGARCSVDGSAVFVEAGGGVETEDGGVAMRPGISAGVEDGSGGARGYRGVRMSVSMAPRLIL